MMIHNFIIHYHVMFKTFIMINYDIINVVMPPPLYHNRISSRAVMNLVACCSVGILASKAVSPRVMMRPLVRCHHHSRNEVP